MRELAEAGPAPKRSPAKRRSRILHAVDLRYVAVEILIVAVGVFIALLVDEVRQSSAHRSLAAETRAALRDEAAHNRSRVARKLYLLRAAARALEQEPDRAAQLVEARRNDMSRPQDAAWSVAKQTDAIRLLDPDERRRITEAYAAEAVYVELVNDEMNAWTQLAGTAGAGATAEEVRQRDHAIRIWRAYGGRVALAACIAAVRIERQLNAAVPENAGAQVCPAYPVDGDPGVIFRALRVTPPPLQSISG
jgi:hypothetical protein